MDLMGVAAEFFTREFWSSHWGDLIKQIVAAITGIVGAVALIRRPITRAIHRASVKSMPEGGINILVADLTNDSNDRRTTQLQQSLVNELGITNRNSTLRVQRCFQKIALPETHSASAMNALDSFARSLLVRYNAHILVSGQVDDDGIWIRHTLREPAPYEETTAKYCKVDRSTGEFGPEAAHLVSGSLMALLSIDTKPALFELDEFIVLTHKHSAALPATADLMTRINFKVAVGLGQSMKACSIGSASDLQDALVNCREVLRVWPEGKETIERGAVEALLGTFQLALWQLTDKVAIEPLLEGEEFLRLATVHLIGAGNPMAEAFARTRHGLVLRELYFYSASEEKIDASVSSFKQAIRLLDRQHESELWVEAHLELARSMLVRHNLTQAKSTTPSLVGGIVRFVGRLWTADKTSNMELVDGAIAALKQARSASPSSSELYPVISLEWARALIAKAMRDSGVDNIDEALSLFDNARQNWPVRSGLDWAIVCNESSGALSERAQRSGDGSFAARAVELLKDALEGLSSVDFPREWEVMQVNMADAELLAAQLFVGEKRRAVAKNGAMRVRNIIAAWPRDLQHEAKAKLENYASLLSDLANSPLVVK